MAFYDVCRVEKCIPWGLCLCGWLLWLTGDSPWELHQRFSCTWETRRLSVLLIVAVGLTAALMPPLPPTMSRPSTRCPTAIPQTVFSTDKYCLSSAQPPAALHLKTAVVVDFIQRSIPQPRNFHTHSIVFSIDKPCHPPEISLASFVQSPGSALNLSASQSGPKSQRSTDDLNLVPHKRRLTEPTLAFPSYSPPPLCSTSPRVPSFRAHSCHSVGPKIFSFVARVIASLSPFNLLCNLFTCLFTPWSLLLSPPIFSLPRNLFNPTLSSCSDPAPASAHVPLDRVHPCILLVLLLSSLLYFRMNAGCPAQRVLWPLLLLADFSIPPLRTPSPTAFLLSSSGFSRNSCFQVHSIHFYTGSGPCFH